MTTYFDEADSQIGALMKIHAKKRRSDPAIDRSPYSDWETFKKLDSIEEKLVFDCTIAAEWPGFPPDLRTAVHEVILRHAVQSRPINDPENKLVDSVDDHFREISNLSSYLHSIFHQVAQMNIDCFSDSPLSPLRCLYARGEEEREKLVGKPGG